MWLISYYCHLNLLVGTIEVLIYCFGMGEQVAKEQAERRATAQLMFDLGQRAYGKGTYSRAIEFFEGALTIIPPPTLFGGEVGVLPRKGSVSGILLCYQ